MNNAYRIIGDFHTHTIASQHAYSTIYENLVALAVTDHGPEMMDGAIRHHFFCMTGLPQEPRRHQALPWL